MSDRFAKLPGPRYNEPLMLNPYVSISPCPIFAARRKQQFGSIVSVKVLLNLAALDLAGLLLASSYVKRSQIKNTAATD